MAYSENYAPRVEFDVTAFEMTVKNNQLDIAELKITNYDKVENFIGTNLKENVSIPAYNKFREQWKKEYKEYLDRTKNEKTSGSERE